ncbi:MAG: acetyl-CoA carboxylase biotin carboxyl carrier protein subunit [Luteibaculum sp.]
MFKIEVNKSKFEILPDSQNGLKGLVNGAPYELDAVKVKSGEYHVLWNQKSFNIELIKFINDTKHLELLVNGNKYLVEVKDDFDALLENLGLDLAGAGAAKEIKAPMPGLVVDILVEEGQELKEGDPVLILEAMKMENVLKAPADVTVSKIDVNKGTAVTKNQVLIHF